MPEVIETVSYASTNVPQAIPDAIGNRKKTTVTTLVSTLTVPDSFTIADVNVTLNISHTQNSDLIAELVAPNGTRVTLFSQCRRGERSLHEHDLRRPGYHVNHQRLGAVQWQLSPGVAAERAQRHRCGRCVEAGDPRYGPAKHGHAQ